MALRVAPSALGLAAVVLYATGPQAVAFDLLLVAVVLGAAAGLEVVASVVDGERSRASAILAGLGLLSLVAAGATRRPELALGCAAFAGLDRLQLRLRVRVIRAAENP